MSVINDLKKFTEDLHGINGVYLNALETIRFPKAHQEEFLTKVREIFDAHLEAYPGEPFELYKDIIEEAYRRLIRARKGLIRKMVKRTLRDRGRVLWDSTKGTYKKWGSL